MHTPEILLQLGVLLVAARVLGEAARALGAPSVIGEMAAGVLLGPSLIGWLEPTPALRLLAEIGIILLLFEVGLETAVDRLVDAGWQALVVALGGFVTPFLFGFLLSYYGFGLDLLPSLFVGGTLTATSIGVTVRILRDIGRARSWEGEIVLGAAVLDDVLGVLLLALLFDFSTRGEVVPGEIAWLALFIGIYFVAAPVAARLMSMVVHRYQKFSEIPGLIPTSIVALVFLFAALADFIGAPELLGGFAAGLALSRRFFLPFGIAIAGHRSFSEAVTRQIKPIVQLFTPIFFVMVGVSLDLRAIDWGSSFIWLFSISVAVVAIAGKIAGGWLLFKEDLPHRLAVGVAMVPRGEVGLVFAELGRVSGILDAEVYAGTVMVIVYTTLFAPFWLKLFYRLYGSRMREGAGTGPAASPGN